MSPADVYHYTDTVGFGGAETALLTLLANLDRARWRPTLLYHPTPGLRYLIEGASELDVALRPVPQLPLGIEGARRVPPFVRALRQRRPAVFHAHLTWPLACKFGLVGAVLARVPAVVATYHLFVDIDDRLALMQQRVLGRAVDRHVAVSHATCNRLRATFGWSPEKLEVVHNAVDTERYGAPADPRLRAWLGRSSEAPVILSAGRLTDQKGYRYLLESARAVPDAEVVIAGDGPDRADLESYARALNVDQHVRFLGMRRDIPQLLAASDIFVLPSLYEGLPLSILEAMAAGRPVVATSIEGTSEAIRDGETGLLVEPRDARALATALRSLTEDATLRDRLGRAGKDHAHRSFSAKTMADRIMELYERILRGRRAPGV